MLDLGLFVLGVMMELSVVGQDWILSIVELRMTAFSLLPEGMSVAIDCNLYCTWWTNMDSGEREITSN